MSELFIPLAQSPRPTRYRCESSRLVGGDGALLAHGSERDTSPCRDTRFKPKGWALD